MAANTYTITISGVGSELQGVGRLSDGRAAFVKGALPGETVEITIEKEADRYVVARLLSVCEKSPSRRESFCPYYGKCGGCAGQHMCYDETLARKKEIVYNALTRIGGLQDIVVKDTIGMKEPLHYRNKVEYAVDRNGLLGFTAAGSHSIIPILDCSMSEPGISETAAAVQDWLKGAGKNSFLRNIVVRTTASGDIMLILCGQRHENTSRLFPSLPAKVRSVYFCRQNFHPAQALDGTMTLLNGQKALDETLDGMAFSLSPQSFFQINRVQCLHLMQAAADSAKKQSGTAVDVYCGIGTLSLAAARQENVDAVYGYEIVQAAVDDAARNAIVNKLQHKSSFFAGDAARTLPKALERIHPDTIIVDPPRKGVAPEALSAIMQAAPERICYISCNCATLARDLKVLKETYNIESVQPVDMFPWTEHVETVCLLVLRNPVTHVDIDVDVEELVQGKRGQATYEQIRDYVME